MRTPRRRRPGLLSEPGRGFCQYLPLFTQHPYLAAQPIEFWLEAPKAGFVIVARLTGPIKRRLAHLRYATPSRGVEVAEFRYQPTHWARAYRFVVIRRLQPEEPTEQLTLFKLGRYHYQVLVANLPLQPLNLWRFYNDRAGIELVIRQLKRDYALGGTSPAITSSPTKP